MACVSFSAVVCAVVAVRGPADPRAGSRVRTYRWSEQPVAHPTHFSLHGCTGAQPSYGHTVLEYHPLGRLCAEKRIEARCVAAVCAEARLCAEKCGCARRRYAGYREAQTGRRRRTRRTGGGATGLCVPVAAAVDDLAASMLPEQARDKWRCWFSSNVPTGGTHVRTSSSTVPVWHALTVLPGSPVHHPQTVDLLRVVSTCAAGCDCMDTTTAA